MNVPKCPVTYSSIVEIAEIVQKIEAESDRKFLKLHRGVIDVTTIDLDWVKSRLNFNTKAIQHYSPNNGDNDFIATIKQTFHLQNHQLLVTPGGMAALDLILSTLGDMNFWIPEYHWGSWNKILKINNKNIQTFNDFNLNDFTPTDGTVMLCYPSNPTGYMAPMNELKSFVDRCNKNQVTVILDMPYFYLFNDFTVNLSNILLDNVILCSSFSKSVGLSGFRAGYVATKNNDLYQHMRIRSLYKYNSISTVTQQIINVLLNEGKEQIFHYKHTTLQHIKKNIELLSQKKILFDKYPLAPIGPFAIIKKDYDALFAKNISSVPLNKFTLIQSSSDEQFTRISVAVDSDNFKKYFDLL
jgi:aspartate/methionine/tyrosine aminotransferase